VIETPARAVTYILDTNVVSALMRRMTSVVERLAQTSPAEDATLVTANIAHMARMPGLHVENWES
jgi:predicted nucleic acid-binding protein